MTFQKKHFSLLAVSASVLTLAGCTHPTSMPSGYTFHHDTYKSATPPPSPKITPQQRQYMDAAQAGQFRDAVYDLLERLTHRAGMPPKPVFVLAPDPMTTFYANIDNDLREGMRHIGYALSDTPVGAYVFAYDARLIEKPRGHISAGEPNVELVLKVFNQVGEDARQLSQESGFYFIQGAEILNIQPATYRILPSQEQIRRQASGFTPHEDSRTATQFTTLPVETSRPATAHQSPFTSSNRPVIAAPAPVAGDLPPPPPVRYSGPSQAVTIDSSGVSYDAPAVNTQPLSPRTRVSREVEY